MTVKQLSEKFFEKTGRHISKNRAGTVVASFQDCMLWGRSTYIHERHTPYPTELLGIVADLAVQIFQTNKISLIGVEGLYKEFEQEFQSFGIPTHHALYSLLRKYDDSRLTLREYPWICQTTTIGDRTSFAKYFYSVLESNNGFITDAHAEAIARRSFAQSFALGGLAEYSPFVIHANGGWYDIAAGNFDLDGIASLACDIASRMRENDIISAVKVFDDYRERCFSYGVKSYDMLYYLVDMMEDNLPIEATRRPYFVKSKHKGLSVIAVMRMFIADSPCPITRDELYEEFITKRKVNLRGICSSMLVNDEIIEVGRNTYWSREKLSLDDDFIGAFDAAIDKQIERLRPERIANLFIAREQILSKPSTLPQLAEIPWNTELFKAIFAESKRFMLFGEHGNCIVCHNEHPDVNDTEAFYRVLLQNEFYGWSPFDGFVEYCKAYGINSNLTPEFFDAFSTIQADDVSISIIDDL